jgi:ABC-2 type transport system ATP-binding protein
VRNIPKDDRHDRILETAGLCGLEDRLGQEIGTLSKGFRQRVGLAQALIHKPDILILDEPTSGLDPNQIVEIRNLIKGLGGERTIILSTHNLPEVMATCNRMLIVHNGSLVADGTPADLQAREEENPRVRVVYRGASPGDAATLEAQDGVESAETVVTIEDGAVAFEVMGARGVDVRPTLLALAASQGWELIELHRLVLDLEGIFRKLTKEV